MDDLSTLVKAAQTGDKGAFGQIVRQFQDMAYAVGYAMLGEPQLAQDAAQDAFLDAYLCLPSLREPAAFPGWFRRIVVKHSDRQIRKERVIHLPFDETLSIPSALPGPEEAFDTQEMNTTVSDAIVSLPPNQRLVVTLFYLDGYAQKEIEDFLEMPVPSIKKHLFIARKRLKEKLMTTLQQELHENRPSQSDVFTTKVKFFIALKTHDLSQVKTLLKQHPDLLHIRTEWGFGAEGDYWPVGYTPLHWAAATGDQPLLAHLLSRKADVNAETPNVHLTPAHVAALMRQTDALRQLLDAGANSNAQNSHGHTPFHFAAMRNHVEAVNLLFEHGSDPNISDAGNRTPLDWAQATASRNVGELLAAQGAVSSLTPTHDLSHEPGPILDFGLKMVNLLAPLKRGGQLGIFTPLSGVGKAVILCHFIHEIATRYNGHAIFVGVADEIHPVEDLKLGWREWGVEQQITLIFEETKDYAQLGKKAFAAAETMLKQGHDVLLIVDGDRLPLVETVQMHLETFPNSDNKLTILYQGTHSFGALPEPLNDLDAVITFDSNRAQQGLWPAIDPLRATSILFPDITGTDHAELALRARRLISRYQDLHNIVEIFGLDGLKNHTDRCDAERARKLHRYFTQPLPGAEPWTGVPGQHVSLVETLADCRAILDGEYDSTPEESFQFLGRIKW